MKNPIDQKLIDRATIKAQNAVSKFKKSCSGSGCYCLAHREYNRITASIRRAETFEARWRLEVESIEDELKG